MATIYRFIVEQKAAGSGGRKDSSDAPDKKSPSKKGKWAGIFAGEKGGVEHNRKLRAINPLINRATGGAWEKGLRLSRATMGLVQQNNQTGKFRLSPTAMAIIIAFVLQMLIKWQQSERRKAQERNEQNFKQLENGVGAIHGEYRISTNIFNGRQTYNQNK